MLSAIAAAISDTPLGSTRGCVGNFQAVVVDTAPWVDITSAHRL